eukprot:1085732-Prymnesium_polylepis.3
MCRANAPDRTCMCMRARVGRAMSRGRELRDLRRVRAGVPVLASICRVRATCHCEYMSRYVRLRAQ